MKKMTVIVALFFSISVIGQNLSTIKVIVPDKTDTVYITGNQKSLGNWDPSKISMKKTSDFVREVSVLLTYPAVFKFTRGSWNSEGIVNSLDDNPNLQIKDQNSKNIFIVKAWSDKIARDEYCLSYDIKRINSKILNDERTIKVVLPQSYNKEKKYPVVYITDAGTDNFESILNYLTVLMKSRSIPESILIGTVQKNRGKELDVFMSESGKKFKDFLFKELVPTVDSLYSTSGFNCMAGHSDGAEYNHLLMIEEGNPFRGFINMSTNLNNNVNEEISSFFGKYKGKKMFCFIAGGDYDSEDRLEAGKIICGLYKKNENPNISFTYKQYKADHQNLVSKSLADGILFVFQYFRNLDNYKDFKDYVENYKKNIENIYGFIPESDENDIDFFFGKILDKKDTAMYEYLVNYTSEHDIFKMNSLDRANHYFYMNEYSKSLEFWDKAIKDSENIEPRVFYFNFSKATDAYLIEKNPEGAISFLERCKTKFPQYSLEFNYFTAKIAKTYHIDKKKAAESLKYCKKNFKKNRYFTRDDLDKIK